MLKASFGWLNHWRTNMVLVPNLCIPDGSIPYLDVLIHADKTTSVYRKHTHTNLYTHYSSSTPQSSKECVISSLTRRAHTMCSPCHLEPEIQLMKQILLSNGYPLRRINLIMARTLKNLKKKNPPKLKTSLCQYTPSLSCWLPQRHKVRTPTL